MVAKAERIRVGERFGRWLTVGPPNLKGNSLCLDVLCDCGKRGVVSQTILRQGRSKSCGCLNAELVAARSRKYPKGSTRTYSVWFAMIRRCTNQKDAVWANYGGRGITVCAEWRDFNAFLADMGLAPKGLTLDRLDNEKGYSKGNCAWVTRAENLLNKRNTVRLEWQGETKPLYHWAVQYNMPPKNLYHRLYVNKWALEKALTTPVKFKSKNGESVWDKWCGLSKLNKE